MKLYFTYFGLSFLLLAPLMRAQKATPLIAQNKGESLAAARNRQYLKWHEICLAGDTDKIDTQIDRFEAVLTRFPNDNLARVYLGSAYALKAKHSFFPLTKLNSLKKGKSLMESAVRNAPQEPRVRMVRAIAYYKVPERFDTRPTALADFRKLLAEVKREGSDLRLNEKQAILYFAYRAFSEHKQPQALEAKKLCHQLAPHSKYGKLTR